MNIYDKEQEPYRTYIPDPEAVKQFSMNMKLLWLILFVVLTMLLMPIFLTDFYSSRTGVIVLYSIVVLLSFFTLVNARYMNLYLCNPRVYHDYNFYHYRKNRYNNLNSLLLLRMAVAGIRMGNYENAMDALELTNVKIISRKQRLTYNKALATIEKISSNQPVLNVEKALFPEKQKMLRLVCAARVVLIIFMVSAILILTNCIFNLNII